MKVQYLGINLFDAVRFRFSKSPLFLVFYPTSRCNAFCRHCFNWRNVKNSKSRQELSLEEIKQIATNLGRIKYVTITGGEPFLREDLNDIINLFYVINKTRRIAIHTNGSLPEKVYSITEKVLQSCPKLYVNLCISIDSIFEKHDKIRNTKGLFKNALKTAILLKNLERGYKNFSLRSVSCLSKLNVKDVLNVHKFMEDELGVPHGTALMRGDVFKSGAIRVKPKEYMNIRNELGVYYRKKWSGNYSVLHRLRNTVESLKSKLIIKMIKKRKRVYPCKAGKRVAVIMDNGDIYPCELFNKVEKIGNIRDFDYNLLATLNSPNGKKIIKCVEKKKCWCTWECIIPINLIFNIRSYPSILKKYIFIITAYFCYKLKLINPAHHDAAYGGNILREGNSYQH